MGIRSAPHFFIAGRTPIGMRRQTEQEAHHKVGLIETPRRLIRKRCRYSSIEKFKDAFHAVLHLMQKTRGVPVQIASGQSAGNPAIGLAKIRPKAVGGGIFGGFFELREMPTRSSL